jgi:hypothetical protein
VINALWHKYVLPVLLGALGNALWYFVSAVVPSWMGVGQIKVLANVGNFGYLIFGVLGFILGLVLRRDSSSATKPPTMTSRIRSSQTEGHAALISPSSGPSFGMTVVEATSSLPPRGLEVSQGVQRASRGIHQLTLRIRNNTGVAVRDVRLWLPRIDVQYVVGLLADESKRIEPQYLGKNIEGELFQEAILEYSDSVGIFQQRAVAKVSKETGITEYELQPFGPPSQVNEYRIPSQR